jgi:probable F420-dependent oxidoreductase
MPVKPETLNAYILPGRVLSPTEGLVQARMGEQLGLGGIFLSERWESKDLGAVMGALSQVTSRVQLIAGLTHFGTRHPLTQAGLGATMQMLSDGRFVLGFGRAVPSLFRSMGIPVFNNAGMADYVAILRKLWAGQTVSYKGPAGEYPQMQLGKPCSNPPPVILGAVGPKTLALAGAHFDGLVLHPFLTAEGVERSVKIARTAAREAGRDPEALTIYATVVTAPDTLSIARRTSVLEARAVSYFMHREVGLPLVTMNGWDEAPMNSLVAMGLSQLELGGRDINAARDQLARAADKIPPHWLATGAAVGSVQHCVGRFDDYLAAGANQIVLHGTTPEEQVALTRAVALSTALRS